MAARFELVHVIMIAGALSVIACGDSPAEPDNRLIPVPIAFDVSNEDGFVDDLGNFNSTKERYVVGDGGDSDPNGLVYEITLTNNLDVPLIGPVVTSELAPESGILICRGLLDQSPFGANPSTGAVTGGDCALEGFRWDVGILDGGTTAVLSELDRSALRG